MAHMLSPEPTHNVLRVVDTRLNNVSENQVNHVVEEGAVVTAYIPLTSASHSDQGTNFNLNNIASNVCRDPRLVMSCNVVVTITATNSTGAAIAPIQPFNFGFKQYPLNRCISSVQHQINQASETLTTSEILPEIARLNCFPEDMNFYDNAMPDYIDSYANANMTNFSPLGQYAGTLAGNGVFKPRTTNIQISDNSIPAGESGTVTVLSTLYEPLITPFTNVSAKNAKGLYGINGEVIQLTYLNNLANNMIAYVPVTGLTNVTYTVSLTGGVGQNDLATLYCIYLTPPPSLIPMIPHESVQHYNNYQIFSSQITGSLAPGASTLSVSSQVAQFSTMPFRILVYARINNGSRTPQTPDKYLTIQNITCQIDNGAQFFNGCTTRQLYDISARNGLQMPADCFQQFQLNSTSVSPTTGEPINPLYGCGSCLLIDPSIDGNLRDGVTNNSPGRYIFQVQNAIFTNNTQTTFPSMTLYIVGISNAVLERSGTQYRNYLLSVDEKTVQAAKMLPPVSQEEYQQSRFANSFLSGGNSGLSHFFQSGVSAIRQLAHKGVKYLQQHPELVHQGLALARKAILGAGAKAKHQFGHNVAPKKNMDLFYE